MNTRNSILLVSMICTVSLFLLSLYISAYMQCSEGLRWDLSCSFPERTASFEEFVKQKATAAFEMTLEKYKISSEQLTVQDGLRWNKEFFMAESIADDGNRYYLMAVFAYDSPIDKIDVQIFKIISEKCTTGHIQNKQGCPPEYTQELSILTTSGVDEDLESQKFDDEKIDRVFKRCDYQKMMDDRNWVGFDGNKIRDHQPLYGLDNSTHYIDSNICEWREK